MSTENNNKKQVLVIGGGVAGTEASAKLSQMGYCVTIIEQTDKLGGKLNQWDRLFPNQRPSQELLEIITKSLCSDIRSIFNATVTTVQKEKEKFITTVSNGETIKSDAIVISTGFELFDARKKEEYGYGIYDNVVTSADMEKLFRNGDNVLTTSGAKPKCIGIIHCVGSRDEKAGNTYCSKVCCITAVKQAIELKEHLPDSEIFCFYMDLRMFGRHFEDIYKKAQMEHGIQFIRGRLSEAFENTDGSIMLKAEDTLLNKPLKLNVDLVVLMVGMEPSKKTAYLTNELKVETDSDGFIAQTDMHYAPVKTTTPGIFVAGTCTGPKTIETTINEARMAALEVDNYLKFQNNT